MAEDGLTQVERLRAFLETHPGCSILEITFGLQPFVANPRARLSDLRILGQAEGFSVVKEKRSDGRDGYRLVYLHPVQRELFGDVA